MVLPDISFSLICEGTSRFGAELDSLSDYVNFGVSPALLLYFWCLQSAGWYGWIVSLVYTVCMGCRLARFNAGVDFNASAVTKNFFMGVPAPGGAMLVMLPLVLSFQFGDFQYVRDPRFVSPYIMFIAFMLVSRVPTFSSKMVNRGLVGKLTAGKIVLFISGFALVVYLFISYLWLSLITVSIFYIASFPMSYGALSAKQEKKQEKKKE
jgi:CDP-diacylglycerol--serine O-phosphatidyltransferase